MPALEKATMNVPRLAMTCLAIASSAAMGAVLTLAATEVAAIEPAPSYALVVSRAGHDYREDFNLTLDDCRQAVDVAMGGDLPMNDGARCEAE